MTCSLIHLTRVQVCPRTATTTFVFLSSVRVITSLADHHRLGFALCSAISMEATAKRGVGDLGSRCSLFGFRHIVPRDLAEDKQSPSCYYSWGPNCHPHRHWLNFPNCLIHSRAFGIIPYRSSYMFTWAIGLRRELPIERLELSKLCGSRD